MTRSDHTARAHRSISYRASQKNVRRRASLPVRIAAFAAVSVAALAAVVLLWPHGVQVQPGERAVEITMGGFSTQVLTARAGEAVRVRLINPDSSAHTDGGGWHQLAIPALGVDTKVGPRSQAVVDIPAAAPGEYAFYCDVCCGGKENPSMQGTLRVVA
ncbi:MAG: cupredoxin domain-containing protein [Chloroflexi bacterium]|nr:cupredoxin domain-containing protein [Chloroflexota bacterium]